MTRQETISKIKEVNKEFFSRKTMKFFNCTMKDVSFLISRRRVCVQHREVDYASGKVLSGHAGLYEYNETDFILNPVSL